MKKWIVDGHNLIPKIPGLRLNDPDDEAHLINLMQEYCRISRSRAELFFDGAPPAQGKHVKSGLLHVHFIRLEKTADDAIIHYLQNLTKVDKSIVVVSSDHQVQARARMLHAEVISSEEFSGLMRKEFNKSDVVNQKREQPPTPDEMEEFLTMFLEDNLD